MAELSSARAASGLAEPEELIFSRRWRLWESGFWLACLACYFVFPAHVILLSQIFITGLLALSLDLIVGFAGVISLGHAVFFGLGAYTAGVVAAHGWGEPLTGLIAAAAMAAVLGFASAFLIVRVNGIAVLMITLGVNLLMAEAANRAIWLTGGDDGLQGVTMWPILGRFDFDLYGRVGFFYALAVLFVMFLIARCLVRSPLGLTLTGIRLNPQRMRALGTPVGRRIILIYTISAAMAGVAGGVLAQTTQFVGLDTIGFERSAEVLIMLILGGIGWLYGGLIGAAIFLAAHDQLANLNPQYWMFWLGLILVIVVMVLVGDSFRRVRTALGSLVGRYSGS